MNAHFAEKSPSIPALEQLLEVTRKLAAPFNLTSMLEEVVEAGKQILHADQIFLWLYDPDADQLVLQLDPKAQIRISSDRGIVGESAQTRKIINVPDCYSDPRFSREWDKRTGYRTRCMLALPLVSHDEALVGVLQLLNKVEGVFDEDDERLADYLAAQCAVALQRTQMIEALVESQKLAREVSVAREVQMSTLPTEMPEVPGYEFYGTFIPTDATGGDTFDLVMLKDDRLLLLMGDATGHGIGPALSATQMQAMLRLAFRLGADLDAAFTHVNNQLSEDLPDDRFVTAFMGLLDPARHQLYFHSGGQGPILHFEAASRTCEWFRPTSFPLGAMPIEEPKPGRSLSLAPGDILALLSDGIYEYENPAGEDFGEERVARVMRAHHHLPPTELGAKLLEAVFTFGDTAPQADDITVVLVKRTAH